MGVRGGGGECLDFTPQKYPQNDERLGGNIKGVKRCKIRVVMEGNGG